MHLYLEFENQQIKGEGTDYVGPWTLLGSYDANETACRWVKQYVGQHQVTYQGQIGDQGIMGQWDIDQRLRGEFHIWPIHMTHLNEIYMNQELETDSLPSRSDLLLARTSSG